MRGWPLIAATIWLWCIPALCAPISAPFEGERLDLSGRGQWFEDPSLEMTLLQALDHDGWTPADGRTPNFGFSQSAFWLSISFQNTERARDFVLSIPSAALDEVRAHIFVDGQPVARWVVGDQQPFSSRPIFSNKIAFPIHAPALGTVRVVVRTTSTSPISVPMLLEDKATFERSAEVERFWHGLQFGAMAVLLLFNLFLLVSVKDSLYGHYVGVSFFALLALLARSGYVHQYALSNELWLANRVQLFSLVAVAFFGAWFTIGLLELSTHPRARRVFHGVAILASVGLPLSLIMPFGIAYQSMLVLGFFCAIYGMVCGLRAWREGVRPAGYFSLALGLFVIGAVITFMGTMGIVAETAFTRQGFPLGLGVLVVLLCVALADRIATQREQVEATLRAARRLEQAALHAQAKTLARTNALRAAQWKMLGVERVVTQTLEQRVAERTAELEQLNETLKGLSTTDPLTGINNRRYFDRALATAYQRCAQDRCPLSVLMIDLDHFKRVNDRYGHGTGDRCIRAVAAALSAAARRPADSVCRHGGEVFAILLGDTPADGALNVAERMRAVVGALGLTDNYGTAVQLRVSVGAATAHPSDGDPVVLARLAEVALYAAKRSGRDRVVQHLNAEMSP